MKCACVCLVLWLLCTRIQGQDIFEMSSAAAGAWSHNFLSAEAALINPAAMPAKSGLGLRLVTLRPYFIPGLSRSRISVMSDVSKSFSIAGGLSNLANSDFRELQLFFAAGRKLSEKISVGISLDVANRKVRGYAGINDVRALASLAREINGIQTAISVFLQSSQMDGQSINQGVIGGIGKEWAPSFYTDIAIIVSNTGSAVNGSFQYIALSKLLLAIRVLSNPMRLDFESGWSYQKLRFSILGGWHPYLGWSPGFALEYSPSSKEFR